MPMTTASSRDGVSLRPFEAAHLDDLVQMWRTSFEHGFEPMWQLDDVKYQWERP
jgi:hypothetical protein